MHVILMHMDTHVPAKELGIESEKRREDTDALGAQMGMVKGKEGLVGQKSKDERNW